MTKLVHNRRSSARPQSRAGLVAAVAAAAALIATLVAMGTTAAPTVASPPPTTPPPPPTTAARPTVTLSTTSVNFGAVPVGTLSEEATFTVVNSTGFNAETADLYGDSHFPVPFDDCNTVMNGDSCEFALQFAPTALGPLSAQENIKLCSGANGGGTCVSSNSATLTGTGVTALGTTCAAGSSEGHVSVGSLVLDGCVTTVARSGSLPLYFISGSASALGLSLAPTTATALYPAPSFEDCDQACTEAVAGFNSGTYGAQIVVDPLQKKVATNHDYALSFGLGSDATVLWSGHFNFTIGSGAVIDLNVTPLANLFGVPFEGRFQVFAENGGARVHLNVGLPAVLGGVTGETDIPVAPNGTVGLNSLSIRVGDALIGPLRVRDLAFDYDGSQDYYHGSATLSLPTPNSYALRIGMTLSHNTLSQVSGEVSGLNVPIGYGAYLQRVGADVTLSPHVELGGTVGLSAGPTLSVGGKQIQAAALGGSLKVAFPGTYRVGSSNVYVPYTRVEAGGTLEVPKGSPLSNAATIKNELKGHLAVQTNGYVEAGLQLERSWGSAAKLTGELKGELSSRGFNLEGRAEVNVKFGVSLKATGQAIVSSAGIAGCAEFYWLSGGVGYRWGGSFATFRGCDLGPYRVVVNPTTAGTEQQAIEATASQARVLTGTAGTIPVGIPPLEPEEAIEVTGSGAPPDFSLRGPRGAVIKTSSDPATGAINERYAVFRQASDDTTVIVLRRPTGGTWALAPLPGSAPITSVDEAQGLAPAKASAQVLGTGSERTLRWDLRPEPGQVVTFVELGPEDDRVLAVTDSPQGEVQFQVPDGIAGERRIEAQFQEAGLPRADKIVGSYDAPAPPPVQAPTHLRLSRDGTTVTFSWDQAGVAPTGYDLLVSSGGGSTTELFLPGSARGETITTDLPTESVRVRLRAVGTDDVLGPQGTDVLVSS